MNKTLIKNEAKIRPVGRFYNLKSRADYRDCVKSVLGEDTPPPILELWTECLINQNKVLYQFLDDRVGNKMDDNIVIVDFSEVKDRSDKPCLNQASDFMEG